MIDTHCHLYWDNLPNTNKIVENAKNAGVEKFLCVGTDNETTKKAFQQAEKYSEIFFSSGVHPTGCQDLNINWYEIEEFLKYEKCLAVGECGFDFFHEPYDEELQEDIFVKQRNLAKKYDLPLIIHNRNAKQKLFDFIEKGDKFVVHCFSENAQFAKKVLEFGGMISIGGILTYPKAEDLREIIKKFPLENIMLETDTPFLAPQGNRGKINEPAFMKEVTIKISELKGISIDEVIKITTRNAENFYKI